MWGQRMISNLLYVNYLNIKQYFHCLYSWRWLFILSHTLRSSFWVSGSPHDDVNAGLPSVHWCDIFFKIGFGCLKINNTWTKMFFSLCFMYRVTDGSTVFCWKNCRNSIPFWARKRYFLVIVFKSQDLNFHFAEVDFPSGKKLSLVCTAIRPMFVTFFKKKNEFSPSKVCKFEVICLKLIINS